MPRSARKTDMRLWRLKPVSYITSHCDYTTDGFVTSTHLFKSCLSFAERGLLMGNQRRLMGERWRAFTALSPEVARHRAHWYKGGPFGGRNPGLPIVNQLIFWDFYEPRLRSHG